VGQHDKLYFKQRIHSLIYAGYFERINHLFQKFETLSLGKG